MCFRAPSEMSVAPGHGVSLSLSRRRFCERVAAGPCSASIERSLMERDPACTFEVSEVLEPGGGRGGLLHGLHPHSELYRRLRGLSDITAGITAHRRQGHIPGPTAREPVLRLESNPGEKNGEEGLRGFLETLCWVG